MVLTKGFGDPEEDRWSPTVEEEEAEARFKQKENPKNKKIFKAKNNAFANQGKVNKLLARLYDRGLPADLIFAADRDEDGRINFSE